MPDPKEPSCPAGRKPHSQRVKEIAEILPVDKTGGIAIDNTPEHIAWYLHEIAKYKQLIVEAKDEMSKDIYVIRVRKISN
jgi:hypothetical protein